MSRYISTQMNVNYFLKRGAKGHQGTCLKDTWSKPKAGRIEGRGVYMEGVGEKGRRLYLNNIKIFFLDAFKNYSWHHIVLFLVHNIVIRHLCALWTDPTIVLGSIAVLIVIPQPVAPPVNGGLYFLVPFTLFAHLPTPLNVNY